MVTGLKSFQERFKGYEQQYTIIGGTACDLLMSDEGLDFRATKDIDLVLIIEAVTPHIPFFKQDKPISISGNILFRQDMNIRIKAQAFHNFTDFPTPRILDTHL